MNSQQTPLFMTHHAPVGGWASFTFGAEGMGVSIDLESPMVSDSADFYAGVAQNGILSAFPFLAAAHKTDDADVDVLAEGNKETPPVKSASGWNYFRTGEIHRTLEVCTDTFQAENVTLRVYTPHYPLNDPQTGDITPLSCCPGILMELTVDNTAGDTPATGFLGIGWKEHGRIYTVDTAGVEGLSGLGYRNDWMLAAAAGGGVFTLRGHDMESQLREGRRLLHQTGPGALCIQAAPGETVTLTAAFGFYKEGAGSNGIDTRYYYTRYFNSAAAVCRYLLSRADDVRTDCREEDRRFSARIKDDWVYPLFAQAVRGYDASTQLLTDAAGAVYYNVGEGAYVWRNTMDLAADHLAWELDRNPWVVRNIMELYIRRYAYRDMVRFREYLDREFPGGLSFTHDMGNYFTYSPPGYSGYERETTPRDGCYLYMTTEELLNGIYALSAYGLYTGDGDWLSRQAQIAGELLESLENRDDPDPNRRNGILKAQSTRCGPKGSESTTYDALDHSLMDARGSVYVHVKTIAALVMLEEVFRQNGQEGEAARAVLMRQKAEDALHLFWDETRHCLKANVYTPVESMVLAAIEPLGMLHFLGLDRKLTDETRDMLRQHAETCLIRGNCIDPDTGGLMLSSTSHNSWTSKVILCLYVLKRVLGVEIDRDGILQELTAWCQVYARATTISDQILVNKRQVIGGCYYPRAVTAALWLFE